MKDDAALIRKLVQLERRMDNLAQPEVGVPIAVTNVANPPTDANLDTAFPNAYHGFVGLVDDNNAGTTVWLCAYVNSKWWYELLTEAL